MNGMEFRDLVAASRTYRRVSDRQVGKTVLEGLVDAARLAPCGNNLQALRFPIPSASSTWASRRRRWRSPPVRGASAAA